jgi:hypothetical protein
MRAFHFAVIIAVVGIAGMAAALWNMASERHSSRIPDSSKPEVFPLTSRPPKVPRASSTSFDVPVRVREESATSSTTPPPAASSRDQFASVRQSFERSGAPASDLTAKALGIIDGWKSRAPSDLSGAGRFSAPSCFAHGCTFTADVDDPSSLSAFRNGFVYESGFLEWQGFKTAFEPMDDGRGSHTRLAFAVYAPNIPPNAIEQQTANY